MQHDSCMAPILLCGQRAVQGRESLAMVLGSIRARLVSTSAWLCRFHAEPESDCFLAMVHPCDGQKEGETEIDS